MTLGGSFPVRSETTRRRARVIVVPNGADAATGWADEMRVILGAAAGRRLRPMRRAPPSLCMVGYVLRLAVEYPTREERGDETTLNFDKCPPLTFPRPTAQ